mmetsp:Transcript_22757/g.62518  ORF Transcript_22757/g.62518 Transcript_22757/m.62518 type:complete len:117 (-) Transcript_22757:28-378(-)
MHHPSRRLFSAPRPYPEGRPRSLRAPLLLMSFSRRPVLIRLLAPEVESCQRLQGLVDKSTPKKWDPHVMSDTLTDEKAGVSRRAVLVRTQRLNERPNQSERASVEVPSNNHSRVLL